MSITEWAPGTVIRGDEMEEIRKEVEKLRNLQIEASQMAFTPTFRRVTQAQSEAEEQRRLARQQQLDQQQATTGASSGLVPFMQEKADSYGQEHRSEGYSVGIPIRPHTLLCSPAMAKQAEALFNSTPAYYNNEASALTPESIEKARRVMMDEEIEISKEELSCNPELYNETKERMLSKLGRNDVLEIFEHDYRMKTIFCIKRMNEKLKSYSKKFFGNTLNQLRHEFTEWTKDIFNLDYLKDVKVNCYERNN